VRDLFEGMAATYGIVNLVSSFGFCRRWRRQCVTLAAPAAGMVVYDLMSGMGECWPTIARAVGARGRIVGLDFSPAMCVRARRTAARVRGPAIELLERDVLGNAIPSRAADCIVCSFGLKTLSPAQRDRLAAEIARVLKPGGTFSLLEISVPRARLLRAAYMFYVKRCIPVIGRLLLGNPDHYRLLGVYTEAFGDASGMVEPLRARGLEVEFRRLFFGCATAVRGRRA
jgi:demethylmenaquinone methyltransferase/2-methoxy-6-polyprenyl-1,4-benzoquinol methylase